MSDQTVRELEKIRRALEELVRQGRELVKVGRKLVAEDVRARVVDEPMPGQATIDEALKAEAGARTEPAGGEAE